jgi:hypothetical protein
MTKADLKMIGLAISVHQPWGERHDSISPAPGQSYTKDKFVHVAAQTRGVVGVINLWV